MSSRQASRRNLSRKSFGCLDIIWLLLAIAIVGFVSGWYSGTSAESISPTILPIFAGLIGVFLMARNVPALFGLAAVGGFCLTFGTGLDLGENVRVRETMGDLLRTMETTVSDEVATEMTLVNLQLLKFDLQPRERYEVLHGVLLRIVSDKTLGDEEKLENLKAYSARLESISH